MTDRPIRKFLEVIGLLNRGKFAERLDAELAEAIQTLEAQPNEQGKATITVTVDLAFQSGMLQLTPKVKAKLPEGQGFSATPFWTVDGDALSVQHPNQMDMWTREAPARERDSA